jgi:hypothetical protein
VGGSDLRHTPTTACNNKRQARLPTDHFRRLLVEACPNHAYPIRHKLKDCGMMRSLMTSGSITRGAELDTGPDGSDTMPFPEENAVMIVYGGHSLSWRHCMSRLRPRAPTHYCWGHGGSGV